MIRKVRIRNYKSITNLDLDLERITTLIGANGSGKSNILEAITLASAAAQNKLDNEFLASRGVRVTDTRFMRCAFGDATLPSSEAAKSINIRVDGDNDVHFSCELSVDESGSFPKWSQNFSVLAEVLLPLLRPAKPRPNAPKITTELLEQMFEEVSPEVAELLFKKRAGTLPGFLIYAPENSALRTFQAEGQILPLGIRGEGIFAHLKMLNSDKHKDRLKKIKEHLSLIDWYETFDIPEGLGPGERSIRIRDRYLADGASFDQRSANEGFLFLLFYVALFISPDTPAFFSIDNIDNSLNPKLCITLLRQIATLAREYDKQVILTTHNPAVLDGLNLHEQDQRLLVVERNKVGHTRIRRVDAPKPTGGEAVVSLSEAFLRGYIGGLPKNF
ncbi:MAG: AAA family ATPase [Gemmataceae bacterium]